VLMTIAGLFALLLGFGAWKTLDDQRRSATENLDLLLTRFNQQFETALGEHQRKANEAIDDVRTLRTEIQQDFPMFGRMRRNFARVLNELRSACQGLEPSDEAFAKLTWEERERILFYERAVADTLLLDTRDLNHELSEIHRLLGIFYGSRYADYRSRQTEVQLGDTDRGDIDRARFYFDRAILLDPENYLAYSHAGHFTMYFDDPVLCGAAREYLKQAAAAAPAKQKPLLNLALLELSTARLDAALRAVESGRGRAEYEADGSSPRNHYFEYVKACILAAQAKAAGRRDERRDLCSAALLCLEDAANAADLWIAAEFRETGFQAKPDRDVYFDVISEFPELHDRMAAVSAKIQGVEK